MFKFWWICSSDRSCQKPLLSDLSVQVSSKITSTPTDDDTNAAGGAAAGQDDDEVLLNGV